MTHRTLSTYVLLAILTVFGCERDETETDSNDPVVEQPDPGPPPPQNPDWTPCECEQPTAELACYCDPEGAEVLSQTSAHRTVNSDFVDGRPRHVEHYGFPGPRLQQIVQNNPDGSYDIDGGTLVAEIHWREQPPEGFGQPDGAFDAVCLELPIDCETETQTGCTHTHCTTEVSVPPTIEEIGLELRPGRHWFVEEDLSGFPCEVDAWGWPVTCEYDLDHDPGLDTVVAFHYSDEGELVIGSGDYQHDGTEDYRCIALDIGPPSTEVLERVHCGFTSEGRRRDDLRQARHFLGRLDEPAVIRFCTLHEVRGLDRNVCDALDYAIEEGSTRSAGRSAVADYLATKGIRRLAGYMVSQIERGFYEVSEDGERVHALLRTVTTAFSTTGTFRLWVRQTGTEQIETTRGFSQDWPVYTESGVGTLWQAVRDADSGDETREAARNLLQALAAWHLLQFIEERQLDEREFVRLWDRSPF